MLSRNEMREQMILFIRNNIHYPCAFSLAGGDMDCVILAEDEQSFKDLYSQDTSYTGRIVRSNEPTPLENLNDRALTAVFAEVFRRSSDEYKWFKSYNISKWCDMTQDEWEERNNM